MPNFLFHKVSEQEKEDIKRQAKEILDKFSERLAKADTKIPNPEIELENFERSEGTGSTPDSDFRNRVLENVPEKNGDFILTEKKQWK